MSQYNRVIIYLFFVFFKFFSDIFCLGLDAQMFSHVEISSSSASCSKTVKNQESLMQIVYTDNVLACFADNTTIKSKDLLILIKHESIAEKKNKNMHTHDTDSDTKKTSGIKKILFSGNVVIKKKLLTAYTDKLSISVADKRCMLSGNVKINKQKETEQDIPLDVCCQKALLDLETLKIRLYGSPEIPVRTTFVLNSYDKNIKKQT